MKHFMRKFFSTFFTYFRIQNNLLLIIPFCHVVELAKFKYNIAKLSGSMFSKKKKRKKKNKVFDEQILFSFPTSRLIKEKKTERSSEDERLHGK